MSMVMTTTCFRKKNIKFCATAGLIIGTFGILEYYVEGAAISFTSHMLA